jgi:hypothetical protein
VESNLDDHRPGLQPPRFSLASLFLIVTVLGVLFAAMTYLGAYAVLIFVVFLLTVAAHVAGNAIGTQLRENGNRRPMSDAPRPKQRPIAPTDFAPASQLHHRSALGMPIVITTVVGSVVGGALGGYGLTMLMERPTLSAILLGVIASAVLGGIWTFIASSFFQVATGALRQATRDTER